jgi:DNA-binding response OmpR family regulator
VGRPRPLVLVVDDAEHIRELIRVILRDQAVAEAENGEEGLLLVRALRPDVVILDVMLPLRSGLEVLAEIRADPELASIPVLVITAQPTTRDEALAAGADAYFEKPFDPVALAAAVQEVLRRSS